jgi:EmrB/QacA subfamily drug resistance transporter
MASTLTPLMVPMDTSSSASRSRRNTLALIAVCLASMMFSLEISSVPVILPTLEKVLHCQFKDVQWIMNAYTLACTTVLMAAGTLADRYGRKRLFMISVVLFGLTSLNCGLATSAPMLIASRFLQGLGGGAMLICLTAILSHQFREGAERSKAFAMWGVILGVGLGFGPIVGGLIVALSSWHWVFLIHVLLALVTLMLAAGSVEESRDPHAQRLDVLGIVTLSVAVFCVTYFITQGPELGFGSVAAIGIIALAVVSFVLFLLVEKLHSYPMFDFSVFRIRNFSGAIFGSIGMNFSFWPFMIYLPIYFQSGLGYGVVPAGLSLLAYTLPTLLIPPLAERLSVRYHPRVVIPSGMFTIGLGFMLMKLGSEADHASWLTMLPGCLLAGAGLGMTNTPVTNTTTGSVPGNRAGMASGIDISARLITLAINIALMGFLLLQGILNYLKHIVGESVDASSLRAVAEKIAAGNLSAAMQLSGADVTGELARAALSHGFSNVMLYGGIGAWALAAISFVAFGRGTTLRQVAYEK